MQYTIITKPKSNINSKISIIYFIDNDNYYILKIFMPLIDNYTSGYITFNEKTIESMNYIINIINELNNLLVYNIRTHKSFINLTNNYVNIDKFKIIKFYLNRYILFNFKKYIYHIISFYVKINIAKYKYSDVNKNMLIYNNDIIVNITLLDTLQKQYLTKIDVKNINSNLIVIEETFSDFSIYTDSY